MAIDHNRLETICSQVRRDIVRMVNKSKSGHPGGSLGCVEFMVSLYFHHLNHQPAFHPDGIGEDLFFLSNGHICPVWYSVLARSGYFEVKELGTFRQLGTRLQGHPATKEHLPGIRMASGSLGQGLSAAIGAAIAKKLNRDSSLVYTLHGDGELQEGQIWEAMMFAAHNKTDNLIATVDYNGKQIDGNTEQVLSLGNLWQKAEAFGWKVFSCNGNNLTELNQTIELAKAETGKQKPVMIIMETIMGKGVDFMEGHHHWHGVAPNDEQTAKALTQLAETLGDF